MQNDHRSRSKIIETNTDPVCRDLHDAFGNHQSPGSPPGLSETAGRAGRRGPPPGRPPGLFLRRPSDVFFLVFGNLVLRIFGVPLSMVRIVGGIILMRIGFSLFMPSSSSNLIPGAGSGSNQQSGDIAFVPLAIPIMFGPGAIATVLGMSSTVKKSGSIIASLAALVAAIVATLFATYLILVYAKKILHRMGPLGIDAATRIVGFFVSAMGMALIFHGLIEAIQDYAAILGQ
jgi:multiple antibiotic resistance protein